MSKDFSHFDETGGISMVDVASKRTTHREAVAVACRDRGRTDDADARDGLKPLARLVRAMLRFDPPLD